jgi:hypothetical protein
LSELLNNKHETISFLDDSKKTHISTLFTIDINNVEYNCNYHCFWDHHEIGNLSPVHCPLEYIFSQGIRSYVSEISKNKYTIRENLSQNSIEKIKNKIGNDDITVLERNLYITDGVFCSFNCCLAYIKDNYKNPIYKNSEQLLYKMYYDMFKKKIEKITPANNWKTLDVYGGKVTIEKFRHNLDSLEYEYKGMIKIRPISHLYEEKYKL